jgi:hypothetical protein
MRTQRVLLVFRRCLGVLVGCLVFGVPLAFADVELSYQHVWVHYDYMAGYDADGEYVSFGPTPAAIQLVVDAFKRHGVILDVDSRHSIIPLHEAIVFDPGNGSHETCPGDSVNFSALKAQYFHPTSNHPWHYAIFGKYMEFAPPGGIPPPCLEQVASGQSVIGGYDFVVTHGFEFDQRTADCFFDFSTGGDLPCWPIPDYWMATTFMHELGHNLGLLHGGDSDINYKPNYVSILSYSYDSGTPILTTSTTTGSGYSYRIDYSDEALAPLKEYDLNEASGVGPTLHPTDLILWYCQPPACPEFTGGLAPAAGPIDWNLNGISTDDHLMIDLNNDGVRTELLTGFNDWAYVHQRLLRPPENASSIAPMMEP